MLASSLNPSLQMVMEARGTDDEIKKAVLTPPLSLDSQDSGSSSSSPKGNYRALLKNIRPGSELTHFQVKNGKGGTGDHETKKAPVVLIAPLSFDSGTSSSEPDYKAPKILQRILSLIKNVRPGSELMQFQLPILFNLPKSHLQTIGESVYCTSIGGDYLLSKCNNGKNPLDRFTVVVAWGISSMARLVNSDVAPFNPILGETHHVSRGNLNVLLEQVSHHPPITALHATDEKNNLEIIWCENISAKFHGASIEAMANGARQLKLLNHGENYVMNTPIYLLRLLPIPKVDWSGNITIRCEESGLEAELCFGGNSFLGFGGYRSIKGRIFESSTTSKTIFKVEGHWDGVVKIKDVADKNKSTVIYNGREALSKLKAPQVKDHKGLKKTESAVVWSEVNQSILNKEWEKAAEAKKAIEERQRELERERKSKGETWVPKHFKLSKSNKPIDGGYECSPKQKLVSSAPIVAPF